MSTVFRTFKPVNTSIAKYVDYYYLDIKPNNAKIEIDCFPHYNTTISIYKSHMNLKKGEVIFKDGVKPVQIFTPIRNTILKVQQLGKVHRVVIVFKPFGIQQFFKKLNFTNFINDYNFFNSDELSELLNNQNITTITKSLDQFLAKRLLEYRNESLEQSLSLIFSNAGTLPIEEIATKVNISRRHLNRLFNTHFGVSVKKFNEIVLFRKTLDKKLFKEPEQSFTDLAYEFNYCDQSHLNKTFKNFTSNSPKKFIRQGTHLGNEDIFWHLKE